MKEKTIKLLNRSFFAVFSHFHYKAVMGENPVTTGYIKDEELYWVFRDSGDDNRYWAFHPRTMRYFNQIELYLQLSQGIPLSQALVVDIDPRDEKPLSQSISRGDMLNISCHLTPLTEDKSAWWGEYNLSPLMGSTFKDAFFISQPGETLTMPLFLDGRVSDFYDFREDHFEVRYRGPGLWIGPSGQPSSMISLSFNPYTTLRHFCQVPAESYLIACSGPVITAQTFDAIYKKFKENNISHIEILCRFNSGELMAVAGYLCWWINYHSQYAFSFTHSKDNATLSGIYPNDKRNNQLFLDFVADCSTSFRGYFAISQGDEHEGVKHDLITPYNFASGFYTNQGRRSFDLSFPVRSEALIILCEKLLQLFDFMSPLTLLCEDSPINQFAADIKLPSLEE